MHVTSSIIVISLLLMVYKNFMRYYAVFGLDGLVVGTEWVASNMTYSVTSKRGLHANILSVPALNQTINSAETAIVN